MAIAETCSQDDRKLEVAVVQQNGNHLTQKELAIPMKDVKDDDEGDEDTAYVEMIVPPDGGWGWVIVAASFMCNLVVDGIMFSYGVFFDHIKQHYNATSAQVSLAGSLQTGFYLMAGPFVSALANRYGFRLVSILGAFIACNAFLLSYFANSIELLYVFYGIIGGIGAGLIYVPAVITTGFYFEKWRALATGISVCGSGIGTLVMAPISQALIAHLGWRGAIVVQAGMLLNCAVFGAMFRPLKPTKVKADVSIETDNPAVEVKTTVLRKGQSTTSLHASQPLRNRFFGTNNNTEYPTAADIVNNSSRSLHTLHKMPDMHILDRHKSNSEKRLSVPIYPEEEIIPDEDLKLAEEENNLLDGDADRLNGKVPMIHRNAISDRRSRADSVTSHRSSKRNSIVKDPQRPFYRDDIFYGGSLSRLSHYKSQMSSVGYHMSVTRLPTTQDLAEEQSGKCVLCPEGVRRILSTMLDVNLLKSPSLLILALSGCLTMMGFYTPFVHIDKRAGRAGIDSNTATLLISVIGIGNTIGRIGLGYVSSLPGVDALMVNNIFITLSGILTIASGWSMSQGYQFFYAAAFGLSVSVFASLRSIIVVDLMGLEKLTNAFGLLLLFQGVGAVVGSPIASAFVDGTGSHTLAFYFAGTIIILSAVICYPLHRINEKEKRQQALREVPILLKT
ncbi:hypothetical protein TKK_0011953 [Trichogramma kaykai]|uniref:Major facilitator superfamily (MFS) profile domain-containing protein n=1 Tax=Trichogramma kaykai TaxID=54128 RepID=A0ABD2WP79_9HYME